MQIREDIERLSRRRVIRWFVRFVRVRLTPSGRAFFLVWLLSATLGATTTTSPIFIIWAFASMALVVAESLARRSLPRLNLQRGPIRPVCAGQELTIDVEIENPTRRTAHDLKVMELTLPATIREVKQDEPAVAERLGPGEKTSLPLKLKCEKRGSYTLKGLHALSSFPVGLFRVIRPSSQASSFLVYPAFKTPASFRVPQGRQYQPGGFLLSSNVGESSEFMHTREYREGDNPRHVHWASWARLGEPVVKVFHEEYFVRMALILDSEVVDPARDDAFESGISVAAGIADYLSRRDYIIDIFAAGASVYHFQAGRALAHFENILEIMACLESAPKVDWSALEQAMVPDAPKLTSVIAVFMDWTQERSDLIGILKSLGVATRIIVVRDGPLSMAQPEDGEERFVKLAPGEDLESRHGPEGESP